MTKNDKPSEGQPADAKLSREDEARQVAQEYADEQREDYQEASQAYQLKATSVGGLFQSPAGWRAFISPLNALSRMIPQDVEKVVEQLLPFGFGQLTPLWPRQLLDLHCLLLFPTPRVQPQALGRSHDGILADTWNSHQRG